MKYPLVNSQALGRTTVFGRPAAPPVSPTPKRLGDPAAYENAREIHGRTTAAYSKLVQILGREKADQALREARESMDRASVD